MTIGDWLDARTPSPPPELRKRLESALGGSLRDEMREAPMVLLHAGSRVLKSVVDAQPQHRGQALDLLAADALVTYAFEAASELGQPLIALGATAMRELVALAPTGR